MSDREQWEARIEFLGKGEEPGWMPLLDSTTGRTEKEAIDRLLAEALARSNGLFATLVREEIRVTTRKLPEFQERPEVSAALVKAARGLVPDDDDIETVEDEAMRFGTDIELL